MARTAEAIGRTKRRSPGGPLTGHRVLNPRGDYPGGDQVTYAEELMQEMGAGAASMSASMARAVLLT